ncbi:MAG: penicillin-binding protein 1C [Bacteroidales bacterium]|nr:penicillin-binding protein 1C [Bacteroidales bacterium]
MRDYIQSVPIKIICLILLVGSLILYWRSLSFPLFPSPTSTVLESREGKLLNAVIADDMQWRFPAKEKTAEKFSICIKQFEDRYFDYHIGFNPISFIRATIQNFRAGDVVSGGSTISMQVIRLSRQGKPRTIREKIIETLLAIRLEIEYSKEEILALYASNAPFGGNIVGLHAASWRYFSRPPEHLSWSESATLAVLPNAPSLIYPGKNKEQLRQKRNRLLKRLTEHNYIDTTTYKLAIHEPLPGKPHDLPQEAMHLLTRVIHDGQKGQRIQTTLDYDLQRQVNTIARFHHNKLTNNDIRNLSVLILNNQTNEVEAYFGNIKDQKEEYGGMNDIITSPRSTGSILKPFLYASMLDEGLILPNSLVRDVPAVYGNYRPVNYNHQFTGAIPASRALSRSLNVPAVHMLNEYGVTRFYNKLKSLGIHTLHYPPKHYGLSLILGGAEATLWDLTNAYSVMARTLLFNNHDHKNENFRFYQAVYQKNRKQSRKNSYSSPFSTSSVWYTIEAIQKTNRPSGHSGWQNFYSSPMVAWKTGTSHGNRDAWAIGITPEYTIGVWAGNADGEGRPELTGIKAAAPLLFHVLDILKPDKWFQKPVEDMQPLKVCRQSGYKASEYCPETKAIQAPHLAERSSLCPYHRIVHLDQSGNYQVTTQCEKPQNIISKPWFVLPPLMEKYYKTHNPFYKVLPPYKNNCGPDSENILDLIYPQNNSQLKLPKDFNAKENEVIFKAIHRNKAIVLFWFIDNNFITSTTDFHEISVKPETGNHILTVTDNNGNSINRKFSITRD